MWSKITRPNYTRSDRRYASDPTDAEWAPIEPLLPPASGWVAPVRPIWRGCECAAVHDAHGLPMAHVAEREFPPRSTVQRYFYAWREDGTWQRINHELLMRVSASFIHRCDRAAARPGRCRLAGR